MLLKVAIAVIVYAILVIPIIIVFCRAASWND